MSIAAIAWVFKQEIYPSTMKFVLVALADNAGDTGETWPSISTISKKTGQDRKTVISAIAKLCKEGWIEDTGRRMGETNQVKVYRLTPKSRTVPEAGHLNGSVSTDEQSRFFAQTVPKTGHGTVREPKRNPTTSADAETVAIAFGQFWNAYPRHTDKASAEKAFKKNNLFDLIEELLKAIEQHKLTRQWQEGIYPHASTWLNQKRWLDDVSKDIQNERTKDNRRNPRGQPAGERGGKTNLNRAATDLSGVGRIH